jgi:hypothetical protein
MPQILGPDSVIGKAVARVRERFGKSKWFPRSDSVFRAPDRAGGSLVAGYSGDSTIGNMTNLDDHPRFVSKVRQR